MILIVGVDRQAGDFPGLFFLGGKQRGTSDDHPVSLHHHELVDIHFQRLPRARHQYPFLLQGGDEPDNAADIVDGGPPQSLVAVRGDHGATAVAAEQFDEQSAVNAVIDEVGAAHAMAAGLMGMAQRGREVIVQASPAGENLCRFCHGQFSRQASAAAREALGADEVDQLMGAKGDCRSGRDIVGAEIEEFARGRITHGREQGNGAVVDDTMDGLMVDAPDAAGVLKVGAFDDTQWAGHDEIAGHHANGGAGHGCVGQPHGQQGLDFHARRACRLLHAIQGRIIGDADPPHIAGLQAALPKTLFDLRAHAMDQYQADAQAVEQRDILHQGGEAAVVEQRAIEAHDENLTAKGIDIRGGVAEPGDEVPVLVGEGFHGHFFKMQILYTYHGCGIIPPCATRHRGLDAELGALRIV